MEQRPVVAELVDHLFKTRRRPDGKEYTYQEVENATDKRLSASYIRKLREGMIRNPGRDALMELCFFFRVPASYFFPELEALAPPEEYTQQDQLHVALRSLEVSPDVKEHLQGLIDALRQHQTEG
jgi:transcriptional regulator with XRE-family HTH domain